MTSLRYQRGIRIRKSKKDRQHNDRKKKDKRTYNDLQNTTHKIKDRVTRTPLKTGSEFRCSGRVGRSFSTSAWPSERGVRWVRPHPPPFPQEKKRFEIQLSYKYNMPDLIMIHYKCDFLLLTQQE